MSEIDPRPWLLKDTVADELRGAVPSSTLDWLAAHPREWQDALLYLKREIESQMAERAASGEDELQWKRGARRVLTLCEGRLAYAKRLTQAEHQRTQADTLGARLKRLEERLGVDE